MNIEALKIEIARVAYNGMTNVQIETAINAVTVITRAPIPVQKFLRWLSKGDRLEKIENARIDTQISAAARTSARYLILIANAGQGLDPDNADDVGAINALVTAAVISAADRTELSTLADQPAISRATQIGLPKVGIHHIVLAKV